MLLWSIAALVILVCVYEYSHIVFCISQVSDKVINIHKCLLVWINIAYTRRLIFILYVVVLLPCGGVTGVCLIANSVYCYISEYIATFPSVSYVTPPSASGSVDPCVDYAVYPGTQSGCCGAPWFVCPLEFRFGCAKFNYCVPKRFF
jgi:hypothetical protein